MRAVSTVVLTGSMIATGCPKEPTPVTATCSEIEKYHSNLGIANVPMYALGKVLMASTSGKQERVYGAAVLALKDTDKTSGKPADETVTIDSKFDLTFTANVPEAVKAAAEAHLGHSANAVLKGVARADITNVFALVNADAALKEMLKNAVEDPEKHFMVVSSLKSADSLELKLDNNAEGKIDANIVKYADVELKVTYRCDGMLKLVGKNAPTGVFYGVTPVRYDKVNDTVVLDDKHPIDLWHFDHTNALGR